MYKKSVSEATVPVSLIVKVEATTSFKSILLPFDVSATVIREAATAVAPAPDAATPRLFAAKVSAPGVVTDMLPVMSSRVEVTTAAEIVTSPTSKVSPVITIEVEVAILIASDVSAVIFSVKALAMSASTIPEPKEIVSVSVNTSETASAPLS